jgi:enoyl-CoA hydratase/carnithine racemase
MGMPDREGEPMETFETITCELKGSVVEVTLNRPESRNAMSHQMVEELLSCFHDLAEEPYSGVRVVVLRAAGKVFCAGGDVRDLREAHSGEVENRTAIARLDELLIAVNEAPQVVIARVQGSALGGGLGLVCVCDIAVAGSGARFALPEVRRACPISYLALCDCSSWIAASSPTYVDWPGGWRSSCL